LPEPQAGARETAPARVIERDEAPTEGWLVEGSRRGGRRQRFAGASVLTIWAFGRSEVLIHVRVSEVGGHYVETIKRTTAWLEKRAVVMNLIRGEARFR